MSGDTFIETTETALGQLAVVLRALAAKPPVRDFAPAANQVARAMAHIYDACDQRRDALGALEAAQARLVLAGAELAGAAEAKQLADAVASLIVASRFAPPREPFAPDTRRPRISVGVVAKRRYDRPSVVPVARALPVPAPAVGAPLEGSGPERIARMLSGIAQQRALPATGPAIDESGEPPEIEIAEMETSVPAGAPVATLAPPPDDASFEREAIRMLFEEIAGLGMQRCPLGGDDWRGRAFIEARLLAALDAFIAFGQPALQRIEAMVSDAPAPDPWRLFAAALVAGAVGGRDLAGVVEAGLRQLDPEDPDTRTALTSACRLATSDGLVTMLRSLVNSSELPLRRAALEALLASGAATLEETAAAAADSDARCKELAILSLAMRRRPEVAAIARDESRSPDPRLVAACYRALALSKSPLAVELASGALTGAVADRAAMVLAIAGDLPEAKLVLDAATRGPTVGKVLALGWAGRLAAAPTLLALLESKADGVPDAAARALARILGEAPIVMRDIEPEELAEPDIADPHVLGEPPPREPLPDEGGSPDQMEMFASDAASWAPLVATARQRHGDDVRLRFGSPYTPSASLDELERSDAIVPSTHEERIMAYDELIIAGKAFVPFDPDAWVAVQVESLAAIRKLVGPSQSAPG